MTDDTTNIETTTALSGRTEFALLCQLDNPLIEFIKVDEDQHIVGAIGNFTIGDLEMIEEAIIAQLFGENGVYYFECEFEPAEYDHVTLGFIQGSEWRPRQIGYIPLDE